MPDQCPRADPGEVAVSRECPGSGPGGPRGTLAARQAMVAPEKAVQKGPAWQGG